MVELVVNLVIGAILSVILRWHFRRFASTLSNRFEFSKNFPMIVLTTLLIISIVKSSLALSLGLVGALSIVRFRTPIKEPEELAYLFLSIAIGLGLGANQWKATILATVVILSAVAILRWQAKNSNRRSVYLSVSSNDEGSDNSLESITHALNKHTVMSDMRRLDVEGKSSEVIYFVDFEDATALPELVKDIQGIIPSAKITFIDQNQLPSL